MKQTHSWVKSWLKSSNPNGLTHSKAKSWSHPRDPKGLEGHPQVALQVLEFKLRSLPARGAQLLLQLFQQRLVATPRFAMETPGKLWQKYGKMGQVGEKWEKNGGNTWKHREIGEHREKWGELDDLDGILRVDEW